MLFGSAQGFEGSGPVAGSLFIKELTLAVQLLDEVDVGQNVRSLGGNLLHLCKVGLHRGQRVTVEIIKDAVVQILRAEVDLVVLAGVLAVQVMGRTDPVIVVLGLVLAQAVPLDAAEDVHLALIFCLELCNGGLVLGGAAGAHAVLAVPLRIAMTGEAQGRQALCTGGTGHFLQGISAIAHRRVAMNTGLLIICHN